MAEKIYKINEEAEIVYQAPNAESGLGGVTAEIVLPSDLKDSSFPDESLVEIGNSGIYKGSFTPDQEGEWKVICHRADGDGQVVKRFSVGLHNVHSVGEVVGGLGSGITDLDGDVAVVDGKVDVIDTKVDGRADTTDGTIDTVEGKIDAIDTKVSSLDTPPMVS